jgi:acetylornithine/succinyldiaminopimelate/putrescine aminotransferase
LRDIKSEKVRNVRGEGLMVAMSMKDRKVSNFIEDCFEDGLIILGAGQNTVRFLPPLDVREREIELAVEIIKENL